MKKMDEEQRLMERENRAAQEQDREDAPKRENQ